MYHLFSKYHISFLNCFVSQKWSQWMFRAMAVAYFMPSGKYGWPMARDSLLMFKISGLKCEINLPMRLSCNCIILYYNLSEFRCLLHWQGCARYLFKDISRKLASAKITFLSETAGRIYKIFRYLCQCVTPLKKYQSTLQL